MNKIKCTPKSKNYKRNWEILSLGYRCRKCPIFGQLSLAGYAQSFVTGELSRLEQNLTVHFRSNFRQQFFRKILLCQKFCLEIVGVGSCQELFLNDHKATKSHFRDEDKTIDVNHEIWIRESPTRFGSEDATIKFS